jgi:hypothetical protein
MIRNLVACRPGSRISAALRRRRKKRPGEVSLIRRRTESSESMTRPPRTQCVGRTRQMGCVYTRCWRVWSCSLAVSVAVSLIDKTRDLTETTKIINKSSKALIEQSKGLIRCTQEVRVQIYLRKKERNRSRKKSQSGSVTQAIIVMAAITTATSTKASMLSYPRCNAKPPITQVMCQILW